MTFVFVNQCIYHLYITILLSSIGVFAQSQWNQDAFDYKPGFFKSVFVDKIRYDTVCC